MLSSKDLLPRSLSVSSTVVSVDVVAVGEVYAPPQSKLVGGSFQYISETPPRDPTAKYRPVIFGVSIGNMAITAGTNGWPFRRVTDKAVLFGSNAHVFCDDPSRPPSGIVEKRIVQPGTHDGGVEADQVAVYDWHQQVFPGEFADSLLVPVGGFIVKYFNKIAEVGNADVRLEMKTSHLNHIDFAVAKPVVDWNSEMLGLNLEGYEFAGLGFAGSDTTGIFCKAKHIVEAGYEPLGKPVCEVSDNDIVVKCGRTSGFTSGKIVGSSAYLAVNYGDYMAIFEDVVIVEGAFMQAGDSGSSVWKHE